MTYVPQKLRAERLFYFDQTKFLSNPKIQRAAVAVAILFPELPICLWYKFAYLVEQQTHPL